jgi:neurofilament heavy polypeptide
MPKKIKKDDMLKEKSDVEDLMSHLEDEYRKANVSEKYYRELKQKYSQKIAEIDKKLAVMDDDKKGSDSKGTDSVKKSGGDVKSAEDSEDESDEEDSEEEKEETEEPEEVQEDATEGEVKEEKKKGHGFLGKLLKKKEKIEKEKQKEETEEPMEEKVEENPEEEKKEESPKEKPKKDKKAKEEVKEKTEEKNEEKKPEGEKEKSGGLLGKLFKKKEKTEEKVKDEQPKDKPAEVEEIELAPDQEMTPEIIEKLAQQVAAQSGTTGTETTPVETEETTGEGEAKKDVGVEIEKLKVMIDTMRDTKRATDESMQGLAESIGEIRSMSFQTDSSLREVTMKIEKIEDDISALRPKEIEKKFINVNAALEKHDMMLEKFDKKTEDMGEKTNKIYEILKTGGGLENIVEVKKDIQKKVDDMKEAMKYTERLAFKTEKIFIDLGKSLEDLVLFKTKQDTLDEAVRELIKSNDSLGLRIDALPTKRDLDIMKSDTAVLQKQIEEINHILPVVKAQVPETITNLRKEREDILMLLDSMEEQSRTGKLSRSEYEQIKSKNLTKLASIEGSLNKEWQKIESAIKMIEPKQPEAVPTRAETVQESQNTEVKEEKPKEEQVKEEVKEPKKEKTEEKKRGHKKNEKTPASDKKEEEKPETKQEEEKPKKEEKHKEESPKEKPKKDKKTEMK